jgi:hypothetical protein
MESADILGYSRHVHVLDEVLAVMEFQSSFGCHGIPMKSPFLQ